MPSISQTPCRLFPLIYICGIMCGFENQWALPFWSQLCPVSWKRGGWGEEVLPQRWATPDACDSFFVDLMFWPRVSREWLNVDWSQQEAWIQRKVLHTLSPEGRLMQPRPAPRSLHAQGLHALWFRSTFSYWLILAFDDGKQINTRKNLNQVI